MVTGLDSMLEQGRRIATFDNDQPGHRAELVDNGEGRRYLVWQGSSSWTKKLTELLECDDRVLPGPVDHHRADRSYETFLIECSSATTEPFDIFAWRNLDNQLCVKALQKLAQTLSVIHSAGWTCGGIERRQLLYDSKHNELSIASLPDLQRLRDEREVLWRDIRIFGELAYENFLDHEYPGGHDLVTLLQDRAAMADTGITAPGLSQLLAGCVTPYGDLAYNDVGALSQGLEHLWAEIRAPLRFRVGSRSTQGAHIFRQNNQDSCSHVVVSSTSGSRQYNAGFFCVADGIGGIEDGERASSLAVRTACASFMRAWNHYDADTICTSPLSFARSIAQVTSQRLALEGDFSPNQNRGGTTFTGLLLAGDRAGLCHVGDSRAYRIRDSEILQLTRDHTLASLLTELGESRAGDENDASHRTIARFFSTSTELGAHRIDGLDSRVAKRLRLDERQRCQQGFAVRRGDLFVLTSDGAHGEVDKNKLRRLLALHRQDPQGLCDAIIEQSLLQVGRDNATAVAILVQ